MHDTQKQFGRDTSAVALTYIGTLVLTSIGQTKKVVRKPEHLKETYIDIKRVYKLLDKKNPEN